MSPGTAVGMRTDANTQLPVGTEGSRVWQRMPPQARTEVRHLRAATTRVATATASPLAQPDQVLQRDLLERSWRPVRSEELPPNLSSRGRQRHVVKDTRLDGDLRERRSSGWFDELAMVQRVERMRS